MKRYTDDELKLMKPSELMDVIREWQYQFPYTPTALFTADIALVRMFKDKLQVLLVQKPAEVDTPFWRFPGGFVDTVEDNSCEKTAYREMGEETGMKAKANSLSYITNVKVPDPRYANKENKIFTNFYELKHESGEAGTGKFDDVARTKWFSLTELKPEMMNPVHKELFEAFLKRYSAEKIMYEMFDKTQELYDSVAKGAKETADKVKEQAANLKKEFDKHVPALYAMGNLLVDKLGKGIEGMFSDINEKIKK